MLDCHNTSYMYCKLKNNILCNKWSRNYLLCYSRDLSEQVLEMYKLQGVFIFNLIKFVPVKYLNYEYPWWSHMLGWLCGLSSMIMIPGYMLYIWFASSGSSSEVIEACHIIFRSHLCNFIYLAFFNIERGLLNHTKYLLFLDWFALIN